MVTSYLTCIQILACISCEPHYEIGCSCLAKVTFGSDVGQGSGVISLFVLVFSWDKIILGGKYSLRSKDNNIP